MKHKDFIHYAQENGMPHFGFLRNLDATENFTQLYTSSIINMEQVIISINNKYVQIPIYTYIIKINKI